MSALGLTISGDKVFVAAASQGLFILNAFTPLSGPAISLAPAPHLDGNTFHVRVQGLAGLPVLLERSADLLLWEGWTNCVLETNPLELQDSGPGLTLCRFYRGVAR